MREISKGNESTALISATVMVSGCHVAFEQDFDWLEETDDRIREKMWLTSIKKTEKFQALRTGYSMPDNCTADSFFYILDYVQRDANL